MSRTNWKAFERRIAKELGGKRILEKGRSVADVRIPFGSEAILIDCKARKTLQVTEGLRKLQDYCTDEEAIGILCRRDNGKKTVSVHMYAEDFIALVDQSNVFLPVACKIAVSISYKDLKRIIQAARKK